jgi:hypothetical protein
MSSSASSPDREYIVAGYLPPTRQMCQLGGATGAIMAVAHQLGVAPTQVPYPQVRAQLLAQAYKLPH